MPTVSVLMPVYNAADFLSAAIESVLCQSYTDWELIVINDGSSDSSKAIISQCTDSRIKYFENPRNLGLIETLNRGIDLSEGQFIARMDADDVSLPYRLQEQVEFLQKNNDFVMCGTNAYVIDNNDVETGRITNLSENADLQINLLFSDPFIHPSMLIRKDALVENKYDKDYKHVEDYELWCRLAKVGKIANLTKRLLKYRWHQTNISIIHSDEQEQRKDEILTTQINRLGINPTVKEICLHKSSFQLYSLGKKNIVQEVDLNEISNWFNKLIIANRGQKLYDQNKFIAYIWSRWCVLCIGKKKYSKMLTPSFASYNLIVLSNFARLVLHLKNK